MSAIKLSQLTLMSVQQNFDTLMQVLIEDIALMVDFPEGQFLDPNDLVDKRRHHRPSSMTSY